MLETSTFPSALALSFETSKKEEFGKLILSLCDFINICISNYEWAWQIMINHDRCQSMSMLISTIHQMDLNPEVFLRTLSFALLQNRDEDNYLSRMIQKYKLALLEMTLKGSNEFFCATLFKFIYENEEEFIVDEWDPQLVEALAKKCLENKDKVALQSMLLISAIAQDVMLEQRQVLSETIESLDKKSSQKLRLLNHFAYKNIKGQRFLVEDMALHRKLVFVANKTLSQYLIAAFDTKKSLIVIICDIISLIATLISNCQEAKAIMASNVGMERGKSSSLMQLLVEIINNDNFGDNPVRSKIWIPNCFRIITASLTSVECRSWIIRTPRFLNGRCVKDLDQTNSDLTLEVLWLDLLLSLTSFAVSISFSSYFISIYLVLPK